MHVIDILHAQRDKRPLSPEDLRTFVLSVARGEVPDYQTSAFLMAVYLNGMSAKLVAEFTMAMCDSGAVVDLSHVQTPIVDKHSTGGVGDKISLALAPLVAACGVTVPMIAGRGLSHTGGTLDKLEAIPGFHVDLSIAQFRGQLGRLGVCITGQTTDMAPADRRLYALRDVTATVESVPLITGSILSKKLAAGVKNLVMDIKVGKGAFMHDLEEARTLSHSLIDVGGTQD